VLWRALVVMCFVRSFRSLSLLFAFQLSFADVSGANHSLIVQATFRCHPFFLSPFNLPQPHLSLVDLSPPLPQVACVDICVLSPAVNQEDSCTQVSIIIITFLNFHVFSVG
jgi:hypothetical protein